MSELNKDKIFNHSYRKTLIREYENLKSDYTKMNALKYKAMYESMPLSSILENSRYIFSEPMKGLEFYTNIVESHAIPFNQITSEFDKVHTYVKENYNKMSDTQKAMYENTLNILENRVNSTRVSINLYDNMMENTESVSDYYDALYEYKMNNDEDAFNFITTLFVEENVNLMDTINIVTECPELSHELLLYLESLYMEKPEYPDDFAMNAFTTNVLSRMMKDSYISEKVNSISNINLRHTIRGLSGVDTSDILSEASVEVASPDDIIYASTESSVNSIYDDDIYAEVLSESNNVEKLLILECEKAVVDIDLGFKLMDDSNMYEHEELPIRNSIVEKICIESSEIEKIPQTTFGHACLLLEESKRLESEITEINEKYFSADGSPSLVISKSLGTIGKDPVSKKSEEEIEKEQLKAEEQKFYVPKKKVELDKDKLDTMTDAEKDDYEYLQRQKKKAERDAKLLKEEIDTSALFEFVNKRTIDGETYPELEPPQKRNIFQRIQNRALDFNVKFKRKLANKKRDAVDAKNAGKAIAKVPTSVGKAIKKDIDKWDEMDDDRRKEYILKPGFRKKYFKALKYCLLHYGAFAINPVLNIVLLICHRVSNTKDIRIRNEVIRELDAEIKIVNEKISDCGPDDKAAKYKLMRIKAKLEAEHARVSANSKFV